MVEHVSMELDGIRHASLKQLHRRTGPPDRADELVEPPGSVLFLLRAVLGGLEEASSGMSGREWNEWWD